MKNKRHNRETYLKFVAKTTQAATYDNYGYTTEEEYKNFLRYVTKHEKIFSWQ